jgi:hypothetical protein
MKKSIAIIILTLLFSASGSIAQELKLTTYGVSPRDVERDTVAQYFDRAYNGLSTVGTETKIFLKGHFEDSTLATPVWTLLEKPAGSNTDLGTTMDMDTSTQVISIIPDIVGVYMVEFADGIFADTLRFNAAKYFGVEGGVVSCIICHNNEQWDFKYDKWLETGHSDMLVRGLEGTLSSHYGEGCISCHTTGFDPDAANDGFDDFPFVFPDTLMTGMYDSMLVAYPDAMARANIQCESCHGPGSGHLGLKANISKSIRTDNCAWCHDSGTHHAFPEQWDHSGDDATEFDGRGFHGGHGKGSFMSRGTRAGCAPCHSGAGYVEWVNEGRPVDEYGLPDDLAFVPEPTLITCATCHDPHDATNIHQLRFEDTQLGDGTPVTIEEYGTGALCMNCHRSRRNAATYTEDPDNASSHFGAHHGPEADLLLAANTPNFKDDQGNNIEFPTSPHAWAVLPGKSQGNACVNCHMAGELADAEGNINLVGGHSWNMNDAEGNDHVKACAPCHGIIGESFKDKKYYVNGDADLDGNGTAEGLQIEIHGLLEQLALLLPPVGEPDVSINDTSLALEVFQAGYVYFWIEEDRSFGVHNPAFAFSLLKVSIEAVGGVVSVDFPESDEGMPQQYQLSQNYPNPFNPTTTIDFTVPEQSDVTITIYDAIGNELDVLFSGAKDAGVHQVTWNASNYASGIYFYRMNSEKFVQVKKMLLLK